MIILLNVLLFAKLLIASVAFVCTGVVIRSRYEAVLSGMGASLPLVTQFVLDLPAFVFLIVPGVLAGICALAMLLRRFGKASAVLSALAMLALTGGSLCAVFALQSVLASPMEAIQGG